MSVLSEVVTSVPRAATKTVKTTNRAQVDHMSEQAAPLNGPSGKSQPLIANGLSERTVDAGVELLPTPTRNENIAFQAGEFPTISDALDYAAKGETGYNFYNVRGVLTEALSYKMVRERAQALARKLAGRFERGSRLCIVAETRPEFFVTFYACQYAGIVPAPLPMPVNLGGKDGYIRQVSQMMTGAGADATIGPKSLESFLEPAAVNAGVTKVLYYEDLGDLAETGIEPVPFARDELCYIQYSSGSTSAPKGVIGTQISVTSNLNGIVQHGLELTNDDRAVCWLPLYHDMGLIGFALSPMFAQRSVDLLATSDFVRRPLMWLTIASRNKCTITYSPSFGYELAAKRNKRNDHDELDLSAMRLAGIGGDMVRPEALKSFAEAFADSGFRESVFTPSYGLAETTLAICFTDIVRPVSLDHVDMRHYNRSGIAQPVSAMTADGQARSFVTCGKPMPGHAVEVRDANNTAVDDRVVGRVFITGPSLTPGYFSDPAASEAMFHDNWLDTGDMGYMLDGELVITGRAKDLIIINGRNIWPQDVEWAVEKVDNVRQGGVAAFSIDNGSGERIVAVAECRGGLTANDRAALRRQIAQVIQVAAGVPSEVVLVRPHSMVLTSSGKLSRAKVREKYLQGDYDEQHGDSVDEGSVAAIAK